MCAVASARLSPPHASALMTALGLLVVAGVGSGFVSDWFVDALRPAIHQLHISQAFAGLVIVAIAGNAVENAVGVRLAAKGRSDLAISVVLSSVAQIAAFLFPLLVLVSLAPADAPDVRPAAALRRRPRADRGDRLADHRGRRGPRVRGLGAHRDLCDPGGDHAV